MRRGPAFALLVPALFALAYLGFVEAAVAGAPPSPLERGLASRGLDVTRALGSPLPDLKSSPTPLALVVLVAPADLAAAERAALRAHVESGGALWILSPDPSALALWGDPSLEAKAFAGFLYAANGSAPALSLAQGGSYAGPGFLALDAGPAHVPLLTADARAFRDTNGNRNLDIGEPSGPFVVAAEAKVGDGRLVVLGAEDASLLPDALAAALAAGLPEGRVVIVDGTGPHAWATPGLRFLALAGLPSGSILAAALVLAAAAALLLLALPRAEPAHAASDGAPSRLSTSYAARLRERARPEDQRLLQSLEGDTAP